MKRSNLCCKSIIRIAVSVVTALVITLPISATAQSVSLNVKDTTGTDKFVVTDSGFVGIGNNDPKRPIHVTGVSSENVQIISHCVAPAPPSATVWGQGGGFLTYFNYPNFGLPQAGDRLGYYLFGSYQTDGVSPLNPAGIIAKAEQNWISSPLSIPTYMSLETTGATGGRTERVRITGDGNVGIGIAGPSQKLEVNGGIRLVTATAKPNCDTNSAGTLWYEKGTTDDTLWVCAQKSSVYAWKQIW